MLRICAEPVGVGASLVGAQATLRIQPMLTRATTRVARYNV